MPLFTDLVVYFAVCFCVSSLSITPLSSVFHDHTYSIMLLFERVAHVLLCGSTQFIQLFWMIQTLKNAVIILIYMHAIYIHVHTHVSEG